MEGPFSSVFGAAGRRDEASAMLGETDGFDTAGLKAAKVLLDEMSK